MPQADVLVVGAGIAGLAAAERLAAAGRRVLVLEGRDRIGGRIHTAHDPDLDVPVELGAEFVHGDPSELIALIRRLGLTVAPARERHQRGLGEAAPPLPDLTHTLAKLLDGAARGRDRAAADLLQEHAATARPGELETVARYLEGFHAADLSLLGTRALAQNERAGDEDGEQIQRVGEGYGTLIRRLADTIDPERCEIRLDAEVRAIRWRRGEVRAQVRVARQGSAEEIVASGLVLTVPLPVLRRLVTGPGSERLEPVPAVWMDALPCLHMGAAHRVVLGFDRRWWVTGEDQGPSFVHGTGESFPVWWTALPSRAPVITGWAGGPRGALMSGRGEDTMIRAALESLASVFGRDVGELRSRLRVAYVHDWSADPLAGGAYSYGGVGAIEARSVLVRPVEATLYLAGEAVAEEGRNATVHGALTSGYRAAERLLADHGGHGTGRG
jgi:monoamine oxidase